MRSHVGVVVGSVAVLGAVAWLVWMLSFRDTATPVSASGVVAEVTADTAGSPPASDEPPSSSSGTGLATEAPEPPAGFVVGKTPGDYGLYAYSTTGFEEIDALGGARHLYPEVTFLTLQPGGCGTISRWSPLEERWDQHELCSGNQGFDVAVYDSYHEWSGRADLQEFDCGPRDTPGIPTIAGSWTYDCVNDDRTEVFEVEGVGPGTLTVGGEQVPVFQVRVVSTLSGGSEGGGEIDTWYLDGTSLVVRRVSKRLSTNASAIGTVTYSESYEIMLEDLLPAAPTG